MEANNNVRFARGVVYSTVIINVEITSLLPEIHILFTGHKCSRGMHKLRSLILILKPHSTSIEILNSRRYLKHCEVNSTPYNWL